MREASQRAHVRWIVDTHTHLWSHEHLGDPFRSEVRAVTAAADRQKVFRNDTSFGYCMQQIESSSLHLQMTRISACKFPSEYVLPTWRAINAAWLVTPVSIRRTKTQSTRSWIAVKFLGLRGREAWRQHIKTAIHSMINSWRYIHKLIALGIPVSATHGHATACECSIGVWPTDPGRTASRGHSPRLRLVIAHVGASLGTGGVVVIRKTPLRLP